MSFDTVSDRSMISIELIDRIILGCLVTQQTAESSISIDTCTLMAGVSGYIGLLLQLTPALYQLLMSLQLALADHIPSVGKIDHGTWRSFESDGHSDVSCGFVDGDLIETFLDLPRSVQQELSKDLRVSVVDDRNRLNVRLSGRTQCRIEYYSGRTGENHRRISTHSLA
jgi:hypothetical protein